MRERTEFLPKVSQVHADLTSTWTQMASQRLSLEDATAAVRELRERHSEYAPTHFVLGVLYLQQGQRVAAIASLEQAVETIRVFGGGHPARHSKEEMADIGQQMMLRVQGANIDGFDAL